MSDVMEWVEKTVKIGSSCGLGSRWAGSRVLRYTRTLELLTDTPDGGERGGGHLVASFAGWDEEDMTYSEDNNSGQIKRQTHENTYMNTQTQNKP